MLSLADNPSEYLYFWLVSVFLESTLIFFFSVAAEVEVGLVLAELKLILRSAWADLILFALEVNRVVSPPSWTELGIGPNLDLIESDNCVLLSGILSEVKFVSLLDCLLAEVGGKITVSVFSVNLRSSVNADGLKRFVKESDIFGIGRLMLLFDRSEVPSCWSCFFRF